MVGVVDRIHMIFLEVAKGVYEWHRGWTEAVAGGTIDSVFPSIES